MTNKKMIVYFSLNTVLRYRKIEKASAEVVSDSPKISHVLTNFDAVIPFSILQNLMKVNKSCTFEMSIINETCITFTFLDFF